MSNEIQKNNHELSIEELETVSGGTSYNPSVSLPTIGSGLSLDVFGNGFPFNNNKKQNESYEKYESYEYEEYTPSN